MSMMAPTMRAIRTQRNDRADTRSKLEVREDGAAGVVLIFLTKL
jgi:hypothetical protein